jgi:hypothetical protein
VASERCIETNTRVRIEVGKVGLAVGCQTNPKGSEVAYCSEKDHRVLAAKVFEACIRDPQVFLHDILLIPPGRK